MLNNEGPSEIVIPERNFKSCFGCKFYSTKLLKSGRNPVYMYNCLHERAPNQNKINTILLGENLKKNEEGYTIPGGWCPF